MHYRTPEVQAEELRKIPPEILNKWDLQGGTANELTRCNTLFRREGYLSKHYDRHYSYKREALTGLRATCESRHALLTLVP